MDTTGASLAEPADESPLRSMTIMVAAMAGGLVIMGVVLALVGARLETPEPWMLVVVAVVTLIYLLPLLFSLAALWLLARPSVLARRVSRAA